MPPPDRRLCPPWSYAAPTGTHQNLLASPREHHSHGKPRRTCLTASDWTPRWMENTQNDPTFTWKAKATWRQWLFKVSHSCNSPIAAKKTHAHGIYCRVCLMEWEAVKKTPTLAKIIASQVGPYGQIFTYRRHRI